MLDDRISLEAEVNDLAFMLYGFDASSRLAVEEWYRLRLLAETVTSVVHEQPEEESD